MECCKRRGPVAWAEDRPPRTRGQDGLKSEYGSLYYLCVRLCSARQKVRDKQESILRVAELRLRCVLVGQLLRARQTVQTSELYVTIQFVCQVSSRGGIGYKRAGLVTVHGPSGGVESG